MPDDFSFYTPNPCGWGNNVPRNNHRGLLRRSLVWPQARLCTLLPIICIDIQLRAPLQSHRQQRDKEKKKSWLGAETLCALSLSEE